MTTPRTPTSLDIAFRHIRVVACLLLITVGGLWDLARAETLPDGNVKSATANGGDISDKFIIFIIDQLIAHVSDAKAGDTSLVMDQRIRVLKSLIGALDQMFNSEITGLGRTSQALGDIFLMRRECRMEIDHAIELYELYSVSNRKTQLKTNPAEVIQRQMLPLLKKLRESVTRFRYFEGLARPSSDKRGGD